VSVGGTSGCDSGFGQHPKFVDHAGLLQRLGIACGFGWLTALCIRMNRRDRSDRT
jgi:hypothetical protein